MRVINFFVYIDKTITRSSLLLLFVKILNIKNSIFCGMIFVNSSIFCKALIYNGQTIPEVISYISSLLSADQLERLFVEPCTSLTSRSLAISRERWEVFSTVRFRSLAHVARFSSRYSSTKIFLMASKYRRLWNNIYCNLNEN